MCCTPPSLETPLGSGNYFDRPRAKRGHRGEHQIEAASHVLATSLLVRVTSVTGQLSLQHACGTPFLAVELRLQWVA
jgi:hypothetical protein